MKHSFKYFSLLSGLLAISSVSFAGGFQQWLQSANAAGNAGAGIAASADNADTSFYNPAALPWIQRQDVGFSALGHLNEVHFEGAISPRLPAGTNPQLSVEAGQDTAALNLFYAAPISSTWGFGFSVTSPFQTSLDYGNTSSAQYLLTHWAFNTTDIGTSLGYRFLPHWSVGLGIDAQRAESQFDQVTASDNTAAQSESSVSDWAFGWNAGILWAPLKSTRLGLSFRSNVRHGSTGSSSTSKISTTLTRMDYTLPASWIASIYQGIGPRWAVLGTAEFTQWAELGGLSLQHFATAKGLSQQNFMSGLRNSCLFSLGLNDQFASDLLLKAGVAYSESANKDNKPHLILPGMNAYIASLGAKMTLSHTASVDLAWSHYFNQQQTVRYTQAVPNQPVDVDGRLSQSANVLGVQINWLMT